MEEVLGTPAPSADRFSCVWVVVVDTHRVGFKDTDRLHQLVFTERPSAFKAYNLLEARYGQMDRTRRLALRSTTLRYILYWPKSFMTLHRDGRVHLIGEFSLPEREFKIFPMEQPHSSADVMEVLMSIGEPREPYVYKSKTNCFGCTETIPCFVPPTGSPHSIPGRIENLPNNPFMLGVA